MEGTNPDDSANKCLFPRLARSVGHTLGQMLLLIDRPEGLAPCLAEIEVSAKATLLSSDTGKRESEGTEGVITLARVALKVVEAWHETDGLSALGDAIAELQDALETIEVRYVPPSDTGS